MAKIFTTYCIGIDGCKDGWVAVYCPVSDFKKAKSRYYEKLSLLGNDFNETSLGIIDIPIGLEFDKPDRSCDIEARKFLGRRSTTVFSPPCLEAIYSKSYEEAKVINKKRTGKSISKQSWFLSKKILETKHFIESGNNLNLKEGHPECSFAEYVGVPILENKKSMRGIFKRLDILNKLNFNLPNLVAMLPKKAGIRIDDLFDATILCWTANRIINGNGKTFPSSNNAHNKFLIHI